MTSPLPRAAGRGKPSAPGAASRPLGSRHPTLAVALQKLERGEALGAAEIDQLERDLLRGPQAPYPAAPEPSHGEDPLPRAPSGLLEGRATIEGGRRFAARRALPSHLFRLAQDKLVSGVGVGTYHGPLTRDCDEGYAGAVLDCLEGGFNLVDTALNYRLQRSERNVGAAVGRFMRNGGRRDEIAICTKGGFLVPGAITPGTLTGDDVAEGIHSLAPAFLADQLERSRRNLGMATIDVYYIHNPETQAHSAGPRQLIKRLASAFERLELAATDGLIAHYGIATWDGVWDGTLSLPKLLSVAREVGGDEHRLRFLQLPFNVAMRGEMTARQARLPAEARDYGMTVIASAALWQGRLAGPLPAEMTALMPDLATDAQRSLQFARSCPGIGAALVGMADRRHVRENLQLATVPPLEPRRYQSCCSILEGR